ncbi:MAG: GWxTD domain-containing protein [candidate division Zixibacteria bacterium]|nr:GWxTD domain-containing protein [candidate division Zixibacteria bacterium]
MRVKAIIILVACSLITMLLLDGCIYLVRCPREITLGEEAMYEVYYVSTPKQRRELKKLNSQEEVDRFLEAFWNKLDPTPDTPENELRNEYYKRYYYSNANFGEGKTTGWRTDRGRVFIIYGPPDEILQEPMAQSGKTYRLRSIEVWIYDIPASRTKITRDFFGFDLSGVTFIFADVDGVGSYTQIYSTEEGELDDSRFLNIME